jgi:hypothetical protein
MIRHVSVFTFREGAQPAQLTKALDLVCRRVPGHLAAAYGPDAGLRAGNGGYATTFDFVDETAYRAWDTDPEHERIRRELVAPLISGVQRCQYRVKD